MEEGDPRSIHQPVCLGGSQGWNERTAAILCLDLKVICSVEAWGLAAETRARHGLAARGRGLREQASVGLTPEAPPSALQPLFLCGRCCPAFLGSSGISGFSSVSCAVCFPVV